MPTLLVLVARVRAGRRDARRARWPLLRSRARTREESPAKLRHDRDVSRSASASSTTTSPRARSRTPSARRRSTSWRRGFDTSSRSATRDRSVVVARSRGSRRSSSWPACRPRRCSSTSISAIPPRCRRRRPTRQAALQRSRSSRWSRARAADEGESRRSRRLAAARALVSRRSDATTNRPHAYAQAAKRMPRSGAALRRLGGRRRACAGAASSPAGPTELIERALALDPDIRRRWRSRRGGDGTQ